mgnify:CR=1 FL=1
MGTALSSELKRRHENVRAAMAAHDLDLLVVAGNEYTGFEGAVTYMSGFQIVHRYAYVVVPADGDAHVVFPSEARYVGRYGWITARIEDEHCLEAALEWMRESYWLKAPEDVREAAWA